MLITLMLGLTDFKVNICVQRECKQLENNAFYKFATLLQSNRKVTTCKICVETSTNNFYLTANIARARAGKLAAQKLTMDNDFTL